jgi:acyl-CoA reductase-like NAD-dependent aldehyde dehydrogenase
MAQILKVISPVDNRVYAERNFATDREIKAALAAAVRAQNDWQQSSIDERRKICLKAVDYLIDKRELIGEQISWQMGRPIVYSSGEIDGFAERARYMITIAEEKLADLKVDNQNGYTRFIKRDPLGVVFSIVPWNFPYLTAVNLLIPAIMAGNVVIMKPSSQTPLTAEKMVEAFASAGLPVGVFQTLFLDHEATTKIIKSDDVNYVAFTGSISGGKAIESAASGRFIDVGL